MVPHRNLLTFSKYVEDCFLGVRKGLKFAVKKHHKIGAASDRRVAYELGPMSVYSTEPRE